MDKVRLGRTGLMVTRTSFGALPIQRDDMDTAVSILRKAYDAGINYFDTAYTYHGGDSERFLGETLSRYPRDSYYLATKFPGYDLSNMPKVAEIFERQLQKCGVTYFDF